MSYRFRFSLLLALLLTLHTTSVATPHSGGLDAYGCHHDRRQGDYHCHQGQFAGQSFASQAEMQTAGQQNYAAFPPTPSVSQFSGKVVSVLDGDTMRSCTTGEQGESGSTALTHLRRVKRSGRRQSSSCQNKPSERKSRSRHSASISTVGRSGTCSCLTVAC